MGTTDNRCICIQTNTPTTSILQLETRPLSLSDRCLSSGLVREDLLRKSPLGSNVESPVKKINHQQADVIIVAPVWKGQSWFPVLLSLLFDFPHLLLLSTCPILSQHSIPPRSSLRKYNWPHGPPQGILPHKKVFRTSFRTSYCILTTQVYQILQFTLSQVGVLVYSMEWKSYFRSCSGYLKFFGRIISGGVATLMAP